MVLAAQHASEATITCGAVDKAVIPCLNYLRGKGPLTAGCCGGISSLNKLASTTSDRQAACKCVKQAAASFPGINPTTAAGLPGKCGVSVPFKISTST
ncbi:non-specific lipid-transfer protein, partial [Salmonella sp. s57610]|uniref:non-specific lipid-transfer protein n=1 Tax=Salmonella sp. s57610 TaxID=3159697 RepID=UPI00397F91AC